MSSRLNLVRPDSTLPIPPPPQTGGMFDIPGCTFTAVGMIIDPDLKIEHWIAAGLALRRAGDAFQLCVGDWILFGKKTYKRGEMYDRALAVTGFKEGTLRDSVWVAKSIDLSIRTDKSLGSEKLKFSHLRVVAALPSVQDKKEWICKAAIGDKQKPWSVGKLKKEITKASGTSISDGDSFTDALTKIHDRVVREEIDAKLIEIDRWLYTPSDEVLAIVYRRLKQILEWQRDRTIERDCAAIMKMFTGDVGTEAPERVADVDLHAWLRARGFVMSDDDVGQAGFPKRNIEPSGRIGLMIRLRLITAESREESRGDTQRGVITHVYRVERNYLGELEEIELKFETPGERQAAIRKVWKQRLEKYAPELLPKKEENAEATT